MAAIKTTTAVVASLAVCASLATVARAEPSPPMAARKRVTMTVHGTSLSDDYRWLERAQDPAVRRHLQQENAHTEAILGKLGPLKQTLNEEITALLNVEYDDPPERYRSYCYSKHYDPKLDYSIYYRQKNCDGEREILIDLNTQKRPNGFASVGDWDVSLDETRYAYTLDLTGNERHALVVIDIKTKKPVTKAIPDVADFAFAGDEVIFYVTLDPTTRRAYRLYRRDLKQPKSKDTLIYEERDPKFSLDLDTTRSDGLLILTSGSHHHNEVRILPRQKPLDAWKIVNRREENFYAYVEDRGDTLYVLTDHDAPNYKLCKTPLATPTSEHWQTIVAHDPDALLENLVVLEHFTAVEVNRPGKPEITILDADDQPLRTITFDKPVYELSLGRNLDYHASTVRYTTETPIEPDRVEDLDPQSGETNVIWKAPVPGYDPQRYAVQRLWIPSHDKQKIPVTLYYRTDHHGDDPQPLLLRGYGAYGDSYGYGFSSWSIPLLNRGVVIARAHVRGGSEMGRAWHESGRRQYKTNSFDDLISVEEALISRGYTTADQLILSGGSAGGLLMAATINARPDLCRAALLDVPFVDVIGSMLNPKLPLSIEERLEWGDPTKREDFLYMRSYSPYQNLKPQAYPTVMLRTSLHDSRVMYWEPVKYAARLRSLSTSNNPVLLHIDLGGAGHGGRSGRKAGIEETVDELLFYLWVIAQPKTP